MEDPQIVQKILARNKTALLYFYRKYKIKLERYIQTKIGVKEDAEEILQDTLYAFLESIRDYTGKSKINTFLYSICNHKIADYYRRKHIKHALFSQTPQLEILVSPLLTPEDQMEASVLKDKVYKAMEIIFPKYKRLLLSKYVDGDPVSDIALKLATSVKSIESSLFRARKAFVQAFISL